MLFTDRLTLGKPRKTADGYLAVRARAARSGVYEYLGREIDPEGTTFSADQVVRVYRPEDEVFHTDSVASFLMKPVTNDHPTRPVTASNWRDYAKGVVGKALRDGEFLAFDIVLMDADTIKAVEDGKRELSNGYSSEIDFTAGQTPDGMKYDAVQKMIRGNHVAIVDKGRAGEKCRIGDCAACSAIPGGELDKILADSGTYTDDLHDGKNAPARRETSNSGGSQVATKTITFDGLPLEVTDAAEAAITKLQNQLKDANAAKDKAAADLADANKALETEKGKVTALEQQVKDAAVTPEKLQQMVADRAALVAQAKAVSPDLVTDGKTEAEIKKAVVEAKLGDAAKVLSDDAISGAFAIAIKDAKVETTDALRDTIRNQPVNVSDTGLAARNAARSMQYA